MGGYDPEVHHRRSIRLKAYDYSLPGPYFVTICVDHRVCVLGTVDGEGMALSGAGLIIASELNRIEERSPGVSIDASVIMPNHLHAIIAINPAGPPSISDDPFNSVGATFMAPGAPHAQLPQCASTPTIDALPARSAGVAPDSGAHPGTTRADGVAMGQALAGHEGAMGQALAGHEGAMGQALAGHEGAMNVAPTEASVRSSTRLVQGLAIGSLGEVVRAFKAASARVVRRDSDAAFAWQSNYHERVIRNDRELGVFFEYIQTNPARWSSDVFFVANEQATAGRIER